MSGERGSFEEETAEDRKKIGRRWRSAGVLLGLAAAVSLFGGLALPRLRADVPSGPRDFVFSIDKDGGRDCPYGPRGWPRA